MVKRIRPNEREREKDNHPGLSREIAISSGTVASTGIYSSILVSPPGTRTLVHHHGECESSIYVLAGQARFTWGPTGVEEELFAEVGDFIFVPAGEIHTEENPSETDDLQVIVTRNCPEPVTIPVGPDGSDV